MNAYKFNKRANKIVPVIRCCLAKGGWYLFLRKNSPHSKLIHFGLLPEGKIKRLNPALPNIDKMRVADYLDVCTANIIRKKAGEPLLIEKEDKEELF